MNRRTFLYSGSAALGTAAIGFCLVGSEGGNAGSPTLALIWEPDTIHE